MTYKDHKILIVGAGITGGALADFFENEKADWRVLEESDEAAEKIRLKHPARRANVLSGNVDVKIFEGVETVFISPGFPPSHPWIQEAVMRKIPVSGELELASSLVAGDILAVTGTNGKSTTVTLMHRILEDAGKKSALKGNIGSPLITALTEESKGFYVVEVSSYQLETIQAFHPKVAVNLNVTADHLDRYRDMDDYAAAKERIGENQTAGDFFVYNADDPYCAAMAKRAKGHPLPFSLVNPVTEGGFAGKDDLVIRFNGTENRFKLEDCALRGLHNQENMLAAILSTMSVGIEAESIRATLKNFKALKHRVENVGTHKGITFYDDSKGTNVGAVVMSLASFDGNVILILGGRDKGGDYAPLKGLIRGKCKGVIALGEAKEIISKALGQEAPFYRVETMKEAVELSYTLGQEGDTVLLSPACSSFDQYRNYSERGKDFQTWVQHYGQN